MAPIHAHAFKDSCLERAFHGSWPPATSTTVSLSRTAAKPERGSAMSGPGLGARPPKVRRSKPCPRRSNFRALAGGGFASGRSGGASASASAGASAGASSAAASAATASAASASDAESVSASRASASASSEGSDSAAGGGGFSARSASSARLSRRLSRRAKVRGGSGRSSSSGSSLDYKAHHIFGPPTAPLRSIHCSAAAGLDTSNDPVTSAAGPLSLVPPKIHTLLQPSRSFACLGTSTAAHAALLATK